MISAESPSPEAEEVDEDNAEDARRSAPAGLFPSTQKDTSNLSPWTLTSKPIKTDYLTLPSHPATPTKLLSRLTTSSNFTSSQRKNKLQSILKNSSLWTGRPTSTKSNGMNTRRHQSRSLNKRKRQNKVLKHSSSRQHEK